MIILIDNYDSFTYNLVHALGTLGAQSEVFRNDKITVRDVLAAGPQAIVLSPGPATPDKAGICVDLVREAAPSIPVLGVCLGHQAIGEAFGAKVVRATEQMHGKLSEIRHHGSGIFSNLPEGFSATRYHSLVLDRHTLPDCLEITATSDAQTIMGIAHRQFNVHGVQFHPESIASQSGHELLGNFLEMAGM